MRATRRECFLQFTCQLQENVVQTRASVPISRTFESRERWRDRETTSKRCATSSTMLTFRKRVRSASTVISVFSEWPESLGPPALPKALPWLEKERRREKHSHSYVLVHLFIAPSTCPRWRSYPLTELNSFEASSDASSEDSVRVEAEHFIVSRYGVVRQARLCNVQSSVFTDLGMLTLNYNIY